MPAYDFVGCWSRIGCSTHSTIFSTWVSGTISYDCWSSVLTIPCGSSNVCTAGERAQLTESDSHTRILFTQALTASQPVSQLSHPLDPAAQKASHVSRRRACLPLIISVARSKIQTSGRSSLLSKHGRCSCSFRNCTTHLTRYAKWPSCISRKYARIAGGCRWLWTISRVSAIWTIVGIPCLCGTLAC